MNKINWCYLSTNTNAISLLEKNINKIDWHHLSMNPAIFELDYAKMSERMNIVKEELMMKIFHPSNWMKFKDLGYVSDSEET